MQGFDDFTVSDADFGVKTVDMDPSGAFGITLGSGYAITGVQTRTYIRISKCVMSATGPNDVGVFYEIGRGGEFGSQRDNPKNTRMTLPKYDTSCVNAKQALFLNEYISRLQDPITRLQHRSSELYKEIMGDIRLEIVTSRHIQRTTLLVRRALGDYLSDLVNSPGSTVVNTAALQLRNMLKNGKFLSATPVGLGVVNREKLEHRNPKNAPEMESNLLQISLQENPQRWNPQKFGDPALLMHYGDLRGNLGGIILSKSSIDFYEEKNKGFVYYRMGGYYMEISPEHAELIRRSPELSRVVQGKLGNMERKLPSYIPRIVLEAGLVE